MTTDAAKVRQLTARMTLAQLVAIRPDRRRDWLRYMVDVDSQHARRELSYQIALRFGELAARGRA